MTVAFVPELPAQSDTADLTAAVSASPLEPIITVSGLLLDVSLPLVESLPLPLKPDPHALRVRAAVTATAPPMSQRVLLRCIFSPWF
jgi:hypothetical protein